MTAPCRDLKTLLAECASGDRRAQREFQQVYGPLIYAFPGRVFHASADEAGDFYLYVFENDRVFKRSSTFAGRQVLQFENYLSYYVLRDLFLEWLRTRSHAETISLDMPVRRSDTGEQRVTTLQDVLSSEEPTPDTLLMEADTLRDVESMLGRLSPERQLVLKLLALDAIDLAPADVRLMAHLASRSIRETLACIKEVQAALAEKGSKVRDKQDRLRRIAYWIHTYKRQMTALEEQIHRSCLHGETQTETALAQEQAELERKLAWRYRQQARLQAAVQKDVRPSYRDIAKLLNRPVGSIRSMIARARQELGQQLAGIR